MNEYEKIREEIDSYLMKRFKYRLSLVYLTPDNIIVSRRNSRISLYLRIRRVESLFPPDCLIIARISFQKERVGLGSHFVWFLAGIALKYGFKHIGIESVNDKSKAFAEKLGFYSIDGYNYVVSVEELIPYFQNREFGR
ncbi:MAG: GNAT family N-acetyltransferase [Bacteroides sp.]|nr:GNAT family N-acetyltransferase [Bacteroides sp.]